MSNRYWVRLLLLACIGMASLAALAQSNPWTDAQTVQPADLNKELANPKMAPTVLFVGFGRLYGAGHIKGAQFHGSGGSPEGLEQIKAWAAAQPKSMNLVIYCGCCPMERCPNLRPAFSALHAMGFTKLRVLILPYDFAKDWAEKGFPYDKGQ
ncbi:MAG TPA: rhodanese-like domain-containing protein [Methylomirabilota bacterium]|nr:rhodanese-like domain-containing protein [Methylomirabilota bacterium]